MDAEYFKKHEVFKEAGNIFFYLLYVKMNVIRPFTKQGKKTEHRRFMVQIELQLCIKRKGKERNFI